MVDSYGFIDSKACWNSMFWIMFSTANQWEVTKTIFLYFHHYCRYLNQIWSAHRYSTVIFNSRQILQGNLLRFTPTHHWQFWVVIQWWWKCIFSNRFAWFWCISNNFSFCQGFPAVLYLISPIAGQTGAGCRPWSTFQVVNEINISPEIWLANCICATSMPDFIGISFKQAPWKKFDFLNAAKKTLVLQCSVHLKNCPQHIQASNVY